MTTRHSFWTFRSVGNAVVIATALFALTSCAGEEAQQSMPAEQRFRLGMTYFTDGDYLEAIEEFKVIVLQFGGTQWADDAQYYMGEARFLRGEYVLAAYEYDVLLRTMPASEFAKKARFRKAICYDELSPGPQLDQEYTRKAIDEYQSFIEYHPTDSLATAAAARIAALNAKLAQKEFDSGVIYLKMGYYKAATYYFDLVLEKYYDTPFAEQAYLKKAEALLNRRKYEDVVTTLERFLTRYPTSEFRQEAERQIADARAGKIAEAAAASDSLKTLNPRR